MPIKQQPPKQENAKGKKPAFSKTTRLQSLATQNPTQPQSIYLRDGEVVVYRRERSLIYQCRFKLADGTWARQTAGKAALEHAIARACDILNYGGIGK